MHELLYKQYEAKKDKIMKNTSLKSKTFIIFLHDVITLILKFLHGDLIEVNFL